MSNPLDGYIDEYVEETKEAAVNINLAKPKYGPANYTPPAPINPLAERQEKEHELWKQWDANGRKPEDLRPILHSMRPLIQDSVNTWKGRVRYIPDEALESEFTGHAVNAVKTYDPSRGAKLSTWVKTNLRKGGRFVRTYQNVGRIVEERSGNITDFTNTKNELASQLGRPPNDTELMMKLNQNKVGNKNWSVAEIQRMNSEMRADIMSSTFESDPSTWSPSADDEIMSHLSEELSPQEKQVFQYIQNPGPTQGKTGLIAQRLGWSPAKVSRMRKAIEQKAMHYQTVLGRK